jgi:methoxymalonate biosynthesis acyl carrier protein
MEALLENVSIKESIKEFFSKSINISALDEEEDLFDSGIVNSLFYIQLVTFIEKNFLITVTTDDLDMQNFKSVNAVYDFVQRKKGLYDR